MKRINITRACLLSIMMMGVASTTLPALAMNPAIAQHVNCEKEWHLLATKNGVTCYYKVGPLGTCNNAVFLRFVNNSAEALTINYSVTTDGVAVNKTISIAAGQTLDYSSDSSLYVRPASSGEPSVSFTVSK